MKFTRHYHEYYNFVTHYTAENGYEIKGNGGLLIFGGFTRADFWTVYNPNGQEVFASHYLKDCKKFVEDIKK